MTIRKGLTLLLLIALIICACSASFSAHARADEEVYIVHLDPGWDGDTVVTYRSDVAGNMAEDWRSAKNCQFYPDYGKIYFHLDSNYCPFKAPQGMVFDTWDHYTPSVEMTDTEITITVQWKEDLLPIYGPIAGIPKADGGNIYLGRYPWRVIGADDGHMLVIAADLIGGKMTWDDAKDYCGTIFDNFSVTEQNTVDDVSKSDVEYPERAYGPSTLDNVKLFLLSGWEADWYFESDSDRLPGLWWLRSPHINVDYLAGCVGMGGDPINFNTDTAGTFGARPAFVLNLESVLFLSAAEGGKSSAAVGGGEFGAFLASSDSGRKLTLVEGSRSGFSAQTDKTTVIPGGTLTVTYSGAGNGTGEYVSAMLCDADGTALYYASLTSQGSGTWNLALPGDLATGSYTIRLFSEQQNGDCLTDYASSFVTIPLNIASALTYSITDDGAAQAYYYNDSFEQIFPTEAAEGTDLSLWIRENANPGEEYYFTGEFKVDGISLGREYDENHVFSWPIVDFKMPNHDVSIAAVQAQRESMTLDFSQANALTMDYVAWVQLQSRDDILIISDDAGKEFVDLDRSGTPDLAVTEPDGETTSKYTLTLLSKADAVGTFSYTFTGNTDRYGTITLILSIRPVFKGYRLRLSGILGMKYYVSIPQSISDGTMTFQIPYREAQIIRQSEIDTDENGYHVFECNVYAYQMADTITAEFSYTLDGKSKTVTDTYSVKQYLEDIKEGEYSDKAKTLVDATRLYGHFIQPYLARVNGWSYGEKYTTMDAPSGSVDVNAAIAGVSGYTTQTIMDKTAVESARYKLTLNADTVLTVEVELKEEPTGTVTMKVGDETVTPTVSGKRYRVSVSGIAANNLAVSKNITMEIGNSQVFSMTVSPISYVNAVLSNSSADDEKQALAALYEYWRAASAYASQN